VLSSQQVLQAQMLGSKTVKEKPMSDYFGQSVRQETEEVQGGSIAPPPASVSRSGAKATATQTINSNFTANDTPEREIINQDSTIILNALLSVAGTAADVITRESTRQKKLEGARMAGTAEGREAIDAMGDDVLNKIFGPGATQRAGQEKIVQDTTIALNGKLSNDAGTIGLKMSEVEWNAHVEKTIAAQTELYDDEEIKDLITDDFSKRLGTIQSGWIKKSTVYQQGLNKETYNKNLASTFNQVDAGIDDPDPHVQQDARDAIQNILTKPSGMTDEAHKDSLVDALTSQLHQGRIGVFNAIKATGVISTLDQEDQNQLQTAESAYNQKHNTRYLATASDLDASVDAVDLDGNPRFTTSELLEKEAALKALDPIAYAASDRGPLIQRMVDNGEKHNNEKLRKAHNVTLYTTDAHGFSLLSKKEQAEAMTTHLEDKAIDALSQNAQDIAAESGLPPVVAPITQEQITDWKRQNVRAWSGDWKKGQVVSHEIKAMGQDTLFKLESITPDSPGDENLRTELGNLMVLRQTDPMLFTDTFGAEDGAKLEVLFNAINRGGDKPWAAVAKYNQEAERTHQNDGVRMEASEEKKAGDMEKFQEDFLEDIDLSGTDGFLWMARDEPDNWNEIQALASDIYDDVYARTGDGTEAIAEAKAKLLKGGTLVGDQFVPGGQALVDGTVNSVPVNTWLQGLNDDPDTLASIVSTYGLDSNVNLVKDMRFARVSPDGAFLYGTIENASGIGMPVQFGAPQRVEQVLQTNQSKRTRLLEESVRTARDVAQQVINGGSAADNGKQPLNTALEAVTSTFTKVTTGRSSSATPEQIQLNAAHNKARSELDAFDSEVDRKANTYYGKDAVAQVEANEGIELSYIQRRVVEEEGYVRGRYEDTKGNITSGVGQTGMYEGQTFQATFDAHVTRAKGRLPNYDSYPEYLQAELVAAEYRGSLGLSEKTVKLLNAGNPAAAAIEFLNSDEYRAKKTAPGIKARMRRVSDALNAYAQQP